MLVRDAILAFCMAFLVPVCASAQTQSATPGAPPSFSQIAPPVATTVSDRPSIALRRGGENHEQWENFLDQVIVRNVTQPALYPVLLAAGSRNGKAVIIVPGGGYQFVAVDNEGFPVAERLAHEGYVAFVLKYRTTPSARDPRAFLDQTSRLFGNIGRSELPDYQPAVDDLTSALAYVRTHCAALGCSASNINVVGFSAGARTLIRAIEHSPEAAAIHGAALLYPPMTQPIHGGPRPPLFLAIASDDPLFRQGGLALPQAWLGETSAIEFHLYSGGSHGFGTRTHGVTAEHWLDQYVAWLALVGAADATPAH